MSHPVRVLVPAIIMLSACSATPRPSAIVAPPPVAMTAPPPAPMPAGATANMAIPAPHADGGYPTPNLGLSPAAATWHLRAALNVAALACRGSTGDAIVARYNLALLTHATALKQAETGVAAEFRRQGGADWRDRYDDAMTRLYNFFALAPARGDFCVAADRVLDGMANVTPDALPAFAQAQLASLDRPFTDFYRAYDAWRGQRPATTVAAVAVTPVGPATPHLTVDPALFRQP